MNNDYANIGQIESRMRIPRNNYILMAGNHDTIMPVLYRTDLGVIRLGVDDVQLIPFGLSEKPISIEGSVQKPTNIKSQRKKYRLFFESHYLEPR